MTSEVKAARPRLELAVAAAWRRLIAYGSLRSAIWLMADKVLRIVGTLGIGALIARALGPADFGVLSAALAGLALLQAMAGMGLEIVAVRTLTVRENEPGAIIGTVLGLKLLAGVVIGGLVLALARTVFSALLPIAIVVVIAPTLLWGGFDVFDYWAQSNGRFGLIAACRALAHVLSLGARGILLLAAAPVSAFVAAASLEILLGGVALAFVFCHMPNRPVRLRFDRRLAASLLIESTPLWLSSLAIWAYLRLDQVMVAALIGPSDLGQYAAAVRLAESWYFIPMSMVTAGFPALVRLRAHDRAGYRSGYIRLLRVLAGLGLAFGCTASAVGPWMMGLVFGSAYAAAIPAFQILAWVGFFAVWGAAREYWLVAEGLTRFSLPTALAGAILNLGLNLLLIQPFGIVAAAGTTLLAQFVVVTGMMAVWPETRPVLHMQLAALLFWRAI